MRDLLLDTHACVYALVAPARLGRSARRLLKQAERGDAIVWIPTSSRRWCRCAIPSTG